MADSGATPPPNTKEFNSPEALLYELRLHAPELARQAYDRFIREIPEALQWAPEQRITFLQQAEGRFGAILSVMQDGGIAPGELRGDLEAVGADAAHAGTALPHLMITLRISRDLLLQSALRMTAEGKHQHVAAAFVARLLPAIDGLTDALSDGYWSARLAAAASDLQRLTHITNLAGVGVYEADLDGIVQFANNALSELVGQSGRPLQGQSLSDVFRPVAGPGSLAALLAEPERDVAEVTFTIDGPDGRQSLDINTAVRRDGDHVVGFGGLVRKSDTRSSGVDTSGLVRHIEELHRSFDILVEAGTFLVRHGSQMTSVQVEQAGESVRRQGERLLVILDELNEQRKGLS